MSSTTTLIEDFQGFFSRFQKVWNGCNAKEMNALISPDIEVRWVGPGTDISDWGYEETCNGWVEAYKHYEGHDPKWHFNFFQRVSKHPLKEVKASGGCHGIGKECFVQAQSRFRTQLCQGIIDRIAYYTCI